MSDPVVETMAMILAATYVEAAVAREAAGVRTPLPVGPPRLDPKMITSVWKELPEEARRNYRLAARFACGALQASSDSGVPPFSAAIYIQGGQMAFVKGGLA